MRYRKNPVPPTLGTGELRYPGFTGDVTYEIAGDSTALTAKSNAMRGFLTAEPEIAEGAFRAGDGYLTLADGKACRIKMLGYTTGADTAYFEIRI